MSVGHVAGPVASQALEALVGQFADRTSFVRELVQNSLDAGAGRVDITYHLDDGPLVIEVLDDGEGMDRDIIERCLLTLFRSSKERDLTKIGKFGVGFVSLFALNPTRVVVDTARDGLHYRVIFAEDRSYTLLEVDDPFEGTSVRIETALTGNKAHKLVSATDKALHFWCRFARADIASEYHHPTRGWPLREVTGAFTIDAPVLLTVEEPTFRAVLGPAGTGKERVAFHNRGLTLLESDEPLVPGVSFRVEAATLEHTLTRDNVLRDGHFDDVIQRLRTLARGPLRQKWLEQLTAACARSDHPLRSTLLSCTHPDTLPLPFDLPCFPTVTGRLVSVDDLRPKGVLGWTRRHLGSLPTRYCATEAAPLTEAAEHADIPVLLGSPDGPDLVLLTALARVEFERLADHFHLLEPRPHTPLTEAARDIARAAFDGDDVQPARIHPPHDRLAIHSKSVGTIRKGPVQSGSGTLVLNVDHPLLEALAPLPVPVAAPILARALHADAPAASTVHQQLSVALTTEEGAA